MFLIVGEVIVIEEVFIFCGYFLNDLVKISWMGFISFESFRIEKLRNVLKFKNFGLMLEEFNFDISCCEMWKLKRFV